MKSTRWNGCSPLAWSRRSQALNVKAPAAACCSDGLAGNSKGWPLNCKARPTTPSMLLPVAFSAVLA